MENLSALLSASPPVALKIAPSGTSIITLNEDGTVRGISAAGRQLLSYSPQHALPPHFLSLIHGKNLYSVMRDLAKMVFHGKPTARWLLRIRTGEGIWKWCCVSVSNQLGSAQNAILLTLDAI